MCKLAPIILLWASSAVCLPAGEKMAAGDVDDVVKSPQPSPNLRSLIITKADFAGRRSKSQALPAKLPEPFVVSTSLNVRDRGRKGRTWLDDDGRTVVVEGVRVPDDESDRVTWRNGRVINNVFVPYPSSNRGAATRRTGKSAPLNDQVALSAEEAQAYAPPQPAANGRDYQYHAGSTKQGRPVYYVVEEPESLHQDRSPYTYEPADTYTSFESQVQNAY